jgi:hypothetical protein
MGLGSRVMRSWVMGRGSWVVGLGPWVLGRGSWAVRSSRAGTYSWRGHPCQRSYGEAHCGLGNIRDAGIPPNGVGAELIEGSAIFVARASLPAELRKHPCFRVSGNGIVTAGVERLTLQNSLNPQPEALHGTVLRDSPASILGAGWRKPAAGRKKR